MSRSRFDEFARTLAPPMSRRQTLRVAAGLVLAGFLPAARPSFAFADPQTCPGRNELCEPGLVNCGYINPSTVGGICYCCSSMDECFCDTSRNQCFCCANKCGAECCNSGQFCNAGHCITCDSDRVCGNACCNRGEYCDTHTLSADTCQKLCSAEVGGVARPKCGDGNCCTANEVCGFFGCGCRSGYVSTGAGTCVPSKQDPGDPPVSDNWIRRMLTMMGATSAAHSGNPTHAVFAHPAASGSAALDAALDALAAVDGQGAAAMLAIRYGKPDPAFNHKVKVARARPASLAAGAGLDAGSAAALNKLLAAEAHANALIAAMAKSLWRARAAHAKHDGAAARRQLRASATFASQAATALKPVQALRTDAAGALRAGGVSEVTASVAALHAFIATVKSSGIPATLSAHMRRLGVGRADFKHLRAQVLDQTAAAASGPTLIAPLTDPGSAAALKSLISELSKFAVRARKHAIAR